MRARLELALTVREARHDADALLPPGDAQKNVVEPLGIIAATITPEMQATYGSLRIPAGVAVVARITDSASVALASGDVIHAVNGRPVPDLETLRTLLGAFKHGDAVVLQVERQGGLEFVGFELN